MIRVLVNGALGKMGQATAAAVDADPQLELVAQTDMGDDLRAQLKESKAQVAVDFTTAEAGYDNAYLFIESNVCPVIGTSGFTQEQVDRLRVKAQGKNLGGVIAPNFAIGAVLMMKFSAEAAKYLERAEVLEAHHDKKADSPSGTAIRTAEMIVQAQTNPPAVLGDKQILPGARGAALDTVHIHSMRLPGVVAQQTVVFGGLGQTLKIEHNSLDRQSFMPGVCLACRRVVDLDQIYYGLEHLL